MNIQRILSAAVLLSLAVSAKAEFGRPNIVLILADDLGYGDLSCYGATKVQTPNIDRLAAEGMRFTDAYAPSPVCCPSRYALMTGTYPWRAPRHDDQQLWATHRSASLIELYNRGKPNLASVLKESGYATGMVGKWHLGLMNAEGDWNKKLAPGPLECGFGYFFGDASNRYQFYIENHFVAGLDPGQPIREEGGKLVVPPSVHRIDPAGNARVLNDKACAFIRRQAGGKAPFFLYYAPNNVHVPLTPGKAFQGTSQAGAYGDFVQELDWTVGEIVRAVDEIGQLGNTLVILTSDNGGWIDLESRRAGHLTNGGLLGQKTDVWEGGVHVNFIAKWPGVVAPGTVSDALVCLVDIPATAARIAGVSLPEGSFPDGFNLLPVLKGQGTLPADRAVVFNWGNRGKTFGIRQGDWVYIDRQGSGGVSAGDDFDQPRKAYHSYAEIGFVNSDIDPEGLVRVDAPGRQLYNLRTDPAQRQNVLLNNPKQFAFMEALLEKAKAAGNERF